MESSIPFLDIVTPHLELEEEFIAILKEALKTGRFIGGPMVEGLEKDFAEYCNTKYCIGVSSGTDALRFALIAANVRHGDMVLTVPNTFIATTEAITQAGALPEFVDIDEQTCNMDPQKLREFIKSKCDMDYETGKLHHRKTGRPVTAVVPVHLYGQIADMDSIQEISEKYNLITVEDACQAHGAGYFSRRDKQWKRAGSLGKSAAFSFYPGKNLGAFGEGGAVTTDDREIAQKIRMLRDHGQVKKYFHEIEGYNGRLDAIQAGILQTKLKHLPGWNENRLRNALRYNELLKKVDGIRIPYDPEWTRPVYHLYVIRTQNRDELQKYLSDNHIATGLHYPVPLHLQSAYSGLGYKKGDFPVTEKVALEILSLPMYPGITEGQQNRVVEKIKEWVEGRFP